MSMPPNGMPFPSAGMMPGTMPGAAPQAATPVQFQMIIPPDLDWEPYQQTDVLEKDGYYCVKIIKESARSGDKPGVWFTLEVYDDDAKGKILNRFLPDSRNTEKDTWFQWRGLLRAIYGTLDVAKQGIAYTVGMFTNQYAYVKTGAYTDNDGNLRTGIDGWSVRSEWENAIKEGKHRWAPRPKTSGARAGQVGMLPGAVPTGFGGLPGTPAAPGLPGVGVGGGLPGAPAAPGFPAAPMQAAPMALAPVAGPAVTPQPGAAPMQAAPPAPAPTAPAAFSFGAPPAPQPQMPQAPAQAPMAAPANMPAPPAPGQPFSFAQPPAGFAPPNGTVPQPPPTAAGLASSFPGGHPQQ